MMERTLLLIDDEENIVAALARLLRRDGYNILKAAGGREGLELLAQNEVGVIISDQRMPEMTGVEFLNKVKDLYPDTIRIVLSGHTELNAVTDAINRGAIYKFLTKPWEDDLLRANVEEAFQRYEMKMENIQLGQALQEANRQLLNINQMLEQRVEKETLEGRFNLDMLRVSQEILEGLPVAVIGVGEDDLIAVTNRMADELFSAGSRGALVGCYASERLPQIMINSLGGGAKRHACQLENGGNVEFWGYSMGAASVAEGRVLVIVPDPEGMTG
ncbi:MAG: response regulator [Nitrosospira sp.]|nr:response regulator [Nitrosospira sp.]